ncbi:MAG: hypothetical protein JWN70_2785, partial [Planctomycetaceae bacterium]|nr:hypothetical protein [Planctomycetaceae bacterium]
DDYYLKLPFARVDGCKALAGLGDWGVLERLIQHPDSDVFIGRCGTQYSGTFPKTLDAAAPLLNDGYTIGVRHAERSDPTLADLAQRFANVFAAPVDIHLYCTPARHPGFGWHYDAEEVFVLQTSGEKDWYLRKNTVNPLPLIETIPLNQRYEREIMPIQHCKLSAGDWLYIPSGFWHRTAAATDSISLSVGVKATTAIDFFDFIRRELLQSIFWRQRLPPLTADLRSSETKLESVYSHLASVIADEVSAAINNPYAVQSFVQIQLEQAGVLDSEARASTQRIMTTH